MIRQKIKGVTTICLLLSLCSCISEKPIKLPNEGFEPAYLDDGWEISTPEAEGINRQLLEDAFEKVYYQDAFLGARALIVIRNGKLIAESYPRDRNHIYETNNIQSITKSFVSVLTSIALERGDLGSLDTALYDIYPDYFDDDLGKRTLTIEHALTMTTGLAFDESDFLDFYGNAGNSAEYVLHRPLLHLPGTHFNYSDAPPQLLTKAIEVSTEKSLGEYADEYLFSELGITHYKWERARDGTNFGAFGLFVTPRDLAKFGQLLLDNGSWNDRQIMNPDWISQATAIQETLVGGGGQYYGYYLWINPSNGSFGARGNGGQFVYVVPEKALVIVYTAAPSINEYLNDEHGLVNSVINSTY